VIKSLFDSVSFEVDADIAARNIALSDGI